MKFKILICFSMLCLYIYGQKDVHGEANFNNKNYSKAREIYEGLIKQKPNELLYKFRLGRCCFELNDYNCAMTQFELTGSKFPVSYLYLADYYYDNYKFEEASSAYQNYIASLKPEDSTLVAYTAKMKRAEVASRLLNRVNDIAIIDSVVVDKNEFLQFYKFSKELGSLSQMLIKKDSGKFTDKIYYTTERKDRVCFSDTVAGQLDIFTSYKLMDDWTKADTLSSVVNTTANENYPFFMLDGITFYFASDGDNSMGGYDIFMTRYSASSKKYLIPENIGMPFNSPYNDYMMVMDEQRKVGIFASNRFQPAGKVTIYTFVPNAPNQFIKTEDKEYLSRFAALKICRNALKTNNDSTSSQPELHENLDTKIHFVINDSIVYEHYSNFKSLETKNLWLKFQQLSNEFITVGNELNTLRLKYSTTEKNDERLLIGTKIMELEKKHSDYQKTLNSKMIEIRNAENMLLKNNIK